MVDAVDSLLNNAVDLYVQAIHYRRILKSQIPTLVGAEIQQIMPESGDFRQSSPDFVSIVPNSTQAGWNLAGVAGSLAI
jgi:hypothetical protein